MIRSPQVTLYSRDLPRAQAFYEGLGFVESFRYPAQGRTRHVELVLDSFNLGIATVEAAREDHGLELAFDGQGMELVFWNDDTDGLVERLVAAGARVLSEPHDWLDDLRIAWVADLDGNPIQLVQRRQ